jgi:hypothetical protein
VSSRPLEDRLRDVYVTALETSRRGLSTHVAVGFGVMNELEDWVKAKCDWPTLPASPTVWGHPIVHDGNLDRDAIEVRTVQVIE